MKTFALGITLFLLAGAPKTAPQELSPAEALSQALAQIKPCRSESEAHRLDDAHQPLERIEENNGGKSEKPKITLPMLFRPGRYLYADVGNWLVASREVRVVSFYPAPSRSQPQALPGEDKDYHKAMNHLAGWIYFDRETGEIARVDARLNRELSYRWGFVSIKETNIVFEQSFVEGDWQPTVFHLDFDGQGPRGIRRRHEQRTYRFVCE